MAAATFALSVFFTIAVASGIRFGDYEELRREDRIFYPYRDAVALAAEEQDEKSVPTPEDPDGDGVIGDAGKDYPVFQTPPVTGFVCDDKIPGIYADIDTGCQVYHVCHSDGRKDSSLCVNGTVFNQATFACDWWYQVDCKNAANYYGQNAVIAKESLKPHKKIVGDYDKPTKQIYAPKKISPDRQYGPLSKKQSSALPAQYYLYPRHIESSVANLPTIETSVPGAEALLSPIPTVSSLPVSRPKAKKKLHKATTARVPAHLNPALPQRIPVRTADVTEGYSALYLHKPVDESEE